MRHVFLRPHSVTIGHNVPKANATPGPSWRSPAARVNVLWALLRDRRCYELTPPMARAA